MGAREQFVKSDSNGKNYDRFLPSLGLNFKAADTLNFFANTGKAFRAPTFNNLYYSSSFLVGNPELDPEEGWTYEGGIKFDNEFFRLRLAGFYMDYTDKIEIDRSHGYPLTYFNAGDYETVGIKWDASIYPFAGMILYNGNISVPTGTWRIFWRILKKQNVCHQNYPKIYLFTLQAMQWRLSQKKAKRLKWKK